MLLRIVSILFPLFAIVALGYLAGRRMKPDLSHANRLNMDVFVPALVFSALAGKDAHIGGYLPLAGGVLAVVAGSGLVAWLIARVCHIAPKTFVPPLMFNNCGNLGIPLAVLAFGDVALAPAVLMFVVSNLVHFSFGVWLLDHNARLGNVWRVPSVFATIAGLAAGVAGVQIWPPLMTAVRMLGDIAIPLMLFALGVRLTSSRLGAVRLGVLAAVARPLCGMLLAWGAARLAGLSGQEQSLLLVFGALPPAVLNYMFAERYHQEPEVVASIVLTGNLAGLVFLPLALALSLP